MVVAEREPIVPPPSSSEDQRILMSGLRWEDYEAILAMRGERPRPKVTFLRGVLELMSPGRMHERVKSNLGRLLEMWAFREGVRLHGYGSWTLRDRAVERGVEPDECYIVGADPESRKRPDLAIEVVQFHGGVDKLDVYAPLGVGEVWFWEDGGLTIHVLEDGAYVASATSKLLPGLDLRLLGQLAAEEDQHAALETLLARLDQ